MPGNKKYIYENSDGEAFEIQYKRICDELVYAQDTDHYEKTIINLNGTEIHKFTSIEDEKQNIWYWVKNNYLFVLKGCLDDKTAEDIKVSFR